MPKYKLFNHTADIGCDIFGKTRKELFANGVTALFDLILDRKRERGNILAAAGRTTLEEKSITIHGNGLEDLLINFLREVLYLFNGKKWVAIDCRPVEINRKRIVVHLHGEPYNLQKHPATMEIKAVTYHGLSVKKTAQGWKARVIFDV
ncbi:MAG: archease [Syntrophales bacterium LBB04]|nr:archease [Syntrophales bacterium LBB04]